jgi:hypothetical protein
LAAKNIDPLGNGIVNASVETGAQDWNFSCGVCHVGGGQMEYDRDRNPYSLSSPSGDANYYSYMNGAVVAGFMSNTNKAEVDCLLCHLNDGSGMSGNGRAWLQSMGCGPTNPIGPMNDPTCTGTSGMPGLPAAGTFTPGTDYDMYNRNLALKSFRFDLAASMGLGAVATINPTTGQITGISGVPATISAANIQTTPNSQNCSVCHARDDNTPGLPGMINMKYGYGNYAMINPAGTAKDIDKAADLSVANDVLWFELGCKTGMGKRAHRIGQGPNANWGMSMFNVMFNLGKNPGDPIVDQTWDFSPMGMGTLTVKERMPDADVHDMGGMQCATCHYVVGSTALEGGSRTFPAGTHHGVSYPEETVLGIDHNFAQADSLKDTYGKNWLDGTVSCEACHTHQDHPRYFSSPGVPRAGVTPPPTPMHASFPAFHLEKIACSSCHIPETYSAPGRLKYRDHSVGYYKKGVETNGGFRNMLDWNYDLITGSHKTVPNLFVWATKEGEKKITPVLPSEMPIWVKGNGGGNGEAGSEAGQSPDSLPTATSPAPANSRDVIAAARASEAAGVLRRANTINGGNMVPLFDGFSLADAWSVDTAARQNDVAARGGFAKLKVFHAAFDVTHGVVPKEWALGGSKRGGCASCHSSIDKMARNQYGQPTGPNPNYSPHSVGFFEGYQQPLQNTNYSFGVGQYDLVKNWFSLFADYDCTMMCGMGMQPDSTYFDATGNPNMTAACADPFGMGWQNLGHCINFMTSTFDQAMGFPGGTAMMMGMYDGIAGLQGFVARETVDGFTHGCQPFAGPANSPVAQAFGVNVNNCMPPAFSGTCTGPQTNPMWPASCVGGFRNGQGCAMDNDCAGTLSGAAELAKNPNGLIYSRDEVRKNFKITLQNAGKLTWPIAVEQNPGNPAHVASWDQANNCVTNMGMPIPCGTVDMQCTQDGMNPAACINVRTWVNGNELLGYTKEKLGKLISLASGYQTPLAAFTWEADATTSYKVNFDGRTSLCANGPCTYSWAFTNASPASASGSTASSIFSATGTATLTVTDVNGYVSSISKTVTPSAVNGKPTAAGLAGMTQSAYTVSFTDASTDAETAQSALGVTVNWGDGTISTGPGGSAFSHTYSRAMTFSIIQTVTDGQLFASDSVKKSVPVKYSITGNVSGGGSTGTVYLSLLKNGRRVKFTKRTGDGAYSFSNVLPGTYTVRAYKYKYNVVTTTDVVVTNADATAPDITLTLK